MIITYMKAENLKFRRSLFRKLILLIPAGLILMSVIFIFIGIGMGGFSSSVVCNWCMPVACLSVTILCHLANKKEQKHGYRTLYSLPVDLKKTFISKIILTALTLLIISLLLSFITVISECMFSGVRAALERSVLYVAGYCLLWLSFLWQVPFCLFLDRKIGFVGSTLINLFACALGGLFFSLTPLFWFFPYSWTARFMVTLFGVLPSGLLAETDSRLILSPGGSLLLVLVSLLAAAVLSVSFSFWYERQVYRK